MKRESIATVVDLSNIAQYIVDRLRALNSNPDIPVVPECDDYGEELIDIYADYVGTLIEEITPSVYIGHRVSCLSLYRFYDFIGELNSEIKHDLLAAVRETPVLPHAFNVKVISKEYIMLYQGKNNE